VTPGHEVLTTKELQNFELRLMHLGLSCF
jgi:hypothetical protein